MNTIKKTIKEWSVVIALMSLLYFTGWHKELAGFIQRIVLSTGIIQVHELETSLHKKANYDFQLVDQDGKAFKFDQFKGQSVFLNFWATWCPPCIAEMPSIHDLYQNVKEKNVAFVLISKDKDFEKAKIFVRNKGYSFPIYRLSSSLPEIYASPSIPTTFVISPDGYIIAKHTGMAKYNTEAFEKLLLYREDDIQQ